MALDEVGRAVGERGERKREELLIGNDDEPLLEVRGDGRDQQIVAAAQQLVEGRDGQMGAVLSFFFLRRLLMPARAPSDDGAGGVGGNGVDVAAASGG